MPGGGPDGGGGIDPDCCPVSDDCAVPLLFCSAATKACRSAFNVSLLVPPEADAVADVSEAVELADESLLDAVEDCACAAASCTNFISAASTLEVPLLSDDEFVATPGGGPAGSEAPSAPNCALPDATSPLDSMLLSIDCISVDIDANGLPMPVTGALDEADAEPDALVLPVSVVAVVLPPVMPRIML